MSTNSQTLPNQKNPNQKITESEIIKIIEKKKHHHLRPNDSPEGIKTIGGIVSKFFLIAILFFFIAFLCFEYFDIYPFESNVTEGFNAETQSIPEKYIVEPEPQNKSSYPIEGTEISSIFDSDKNITNIQTTSEPKNLDMGVIHSHRYYKSVENSPEAILAKQNDDDVKQTPKMSIASLRQEIPSAYMISLLKQVNKQTFNIKKERLLINGNDNENKGRNEKNYLDSLLDTIHQSKKINQYQVNTLIPFNILLRNLDKENQSVSNALFQICKIYLISLINIKLLELGQSHKAHPFQFLRIINSDNLGIIIPQSTNIKQVAVVFNIVAYRKFKTHGFNIQGVINCKLRDNDVLCNITSLELLGTPMQNDLPVDKLGMTKLLKGYNQVINNGSPISNDGIIGNIEEKHNIPKEQLEKEWIAKNKLMNESIRTVRLNASTYGVEGSDDIDQKQKDQIAELSASQGYSPQLYGSYKCFGVYPDGQSKTLNEIEDPITCQSYIPEIASVGVWDAPCKENTECPFYDASTGEGKCRPDDGMCEMPPGVTRIGYKKYSKYTEKM
jgi:hypothetical protein